MSSGRPGIPLQRPSSSFVAPRAIVSTSNGSRVGELVARSRRGRLRSWRRGSRAPIDGRGAGTYRGRGTRVGRSTPPTSVCQRGGAQCRERTSQGVGESAREVAHRAPKGAGPEDWGLGKAESQRRGERAAARKNSGCRCRSVRHQMEDSAGRRVGHPGKRRAPTFPRRHVGRRGLWIFHRWCCCCRAPVVFRDRFFSYLSFFAFCRWSHAQVFMLVLPIPPVHRRGRSW